MHIFLNKLFAALLIAGTFLLITPATSFALGVGGMQLDSTLNQKLEASIELLGIEPEEVANITVNLAPDAIYSRMGIQLDPILKKLKFSVQQNDKSQFYIHVTTDKVMTEPFLNFLIELNWSNGRLLREFTLLLDPPVLLDEEPAAIEAPTADLPPTFTVTKNANENDIPVTLKTSKTEAISQPEPESIEQELTKILEDEAKTLDSTDNMESLSSSAIQSVSDAEPEMLASTELVYEKVQKNEFLWGIAEKMRPENISVEQMMLALQRENASAFYGDNVSFLKAGAVLRIADTSSLSDITAENAIAEISRQHRDWLAFRRERQAQNAVAVESTTTPKHVAENAAPMDAMGQPNPPVAEQARLKLVSPIDEVNGDAITQTNAVLEAATEKLNQLNIELSIATEAAEAGKHENEELLSRLSALEEQMSAMQSLIQLKDAELHRLKTGVIVGQSQILPAFVVDTAQDTLTASNDPDLMEHKEHANPSFLNDPLTIATGIISTLLVILIGWIVIGRKEKQSIESEVVYSENTQKSLDELFPVEVEEQVEEKINVIKFNDMKTEDVTSEIGIEPLTEITFENTEILDAHESLLDPVAEADVYLTYEKYEKAELLLRDAIESDPDRQELKLKLLEVFALARDILKFDKQAEELYAAIGGDESNSLWEHAMLMAEDVCTKSPLFAAKVIDIEEPQIKEPLDGAKDAVNDELKTEPKAELDKETPVENGNETVTVIWSPEQVTEFDSAPKALVDTEFEIEDNKKSSDNVVVSDVELENAMDSFTEAVLEENWDKAGGEQVDTIVNDAIENATHNSLQEKQDDNKSLDTSLFLLDDEVGTKLDLAKAYMEMGDQEGAFDLLAEVIDEGSSTQVNEAKELMESN